MTDPRIIPRTTHPSMNAVIVEPGSDYTDGYRITVGWSAEDAAWIARASGISTGDVIAFGMSQLQALQALACALAATVDAVNS